MLKTNTNKFKSNMKKYLLDCINYDETENFNSVDKFNHVYKCFQQQAVYTNNIKKFKGSYILIMADWLAGLPFGIDYENYRILEVAKELHDMKESENFTIEQEEMIIEQWFKFIANHLMRECKENEQNYITTL